MVYLKKSVDRNFVCSAEMWNPCTQRHGLPIMVCPFMECPDCYLQSVCKSASNFEVLLGSSWHKTAWVWFMKVMEGEAGSVVPLLSEAFTCSLKLLCGDLGTEQRKENIKYNALLSSVDTFGTWFAFMEMSNNSFQMCLFDGLLGTFLPDPHNGQRDTNY